MELTREELYELVWSTPMRVLARQYGLSDVGLAKICKKHKIPKPTVGYWAKLAHGKRVTKWPLRPIDDQSLRHITLNKPDVVEDVQVRELSRLRTCT